MEHYGEEFELKHVEKSSDIPDFKGSTIFVSQDETISVCCEVGMSNFCVWWGWKGDRGFSKADIS